MKKEYRILLLLPMLFPASGLTQTAGDSWHREPFRLKAGSGYLDTAPHGGAGYAAPYLVDTDNDGRRDLVVGNLDGKFRLYLNEGTDVELKFSSHARWLMSHDIPAEVPNYCCMAAGPRLLDLDGDGVLDLTSGSFLSGAIYWFKGLGNGNYGYRMMLTDSRGLPVYSLDENVYKKGNQDSYATDIAWVDWNQDGLLDLIIGTANGDLYVRLQKAVVKNEHNSAPPPVTGQPMFWSKHSQAELFKLGVVRIDGGGEPKTQPKTVADIRNDMGKAIPDRHATPTVGDWDNDGLFDIVVGSYDGSVYLLRNAGKPGVPEFKTRERLLGAGVNLQWLESGQQPQRGQHSNVQLVDIDRDGKLDLLVGDAFQTTELRSDLNPRERKDAKASLARLGELDKKSGYDYVLARAFWASYKSDKPALDEVRELESRLRGYAKTINYGPPAPHSSIHHGTVWVYLRK